MSATAAIDKAALLEVFLIEARECLQEMREALRALPTGAEGGAIEPPEELLYRRVRIIAGCAPSVGLYGAGQLASALQGVLQGVRTRSLPLTEVLVATLRCSVDRLRDMMPLMVS